jgi:hypothetical protein
MCVPLGIVYRWQLLNVFPNSDLVRLSFCTEILQSPDVELKTITEVDRGIRQLVFTWKVGWRMDQRQSEEIIRKGLMKAV